MFLKKIELYGFKSFANKTILQIDRGVTAIVGPNGSGKSNVIDAIKWVLGEQSVKSLRGSKMEDVIFSGSTNARQKNYAQVILTLDNTNQRLPLDYSEVNISRRYFRDGQSQYFINNTECRLKDIHELFMDTGLGKEAYSIIGQGQVDQILNSRPEERRIIFEEASGIVKYKSKKLDSIKKLEQTQQNLQRVEDIIIEIEESLPKIKEQATQASQYKSLKDKLKQNEVGIVLYKLDELEKTYENTEKQLESHKEKLAHEQDEVEAISNLLDKDKSYLEQLEKSTQNVVQLHLDTKSQVENLKYKLEYLKEKVKDLREKTDEKKFLNKKIKSEISNLKEQSAKLLENKNEYEVALKKHTEEIEDFNRQTTQLSEQIVRTKNDLENKKNNLITLLNDLATAKNDVKNIDGYIQRLNSDVERKEKELEDHKSKQQEVFSKHSMIVEKKDIANKRHREILEDYKKRVEQYKSAEYNKEIQQEQVAEISKKLNALESQLQGLKHLENNFAGYNLGPKEVLKKFSEDPQVFGAVAQIFDVDKKYSLAIETVLGASLQNVVVGDEKAAKKCIDYLKANKAGRATFLPLDIIKGKKVKPIDKKGVIGIASDLVSCPEKLEGIKDFLLGRIFVVENLDSGLHLAKSQGYRYRIVTLDGELINAGGSMSGGRYKSKNAGLLNRNSQMKETSELIITQQKKYDQNMQSLKKQVNELDILKNELEQLKDQEQLQKVEINELDQQKMLLEQKASSVQENIDLLLNETKSLNIDVEKYSSNLSEKKLDIEKMNSNEIKLNEEVKELQTKLSTLEENLGEVQSRQVSQKITIASLKEKISATSREIKRTEERVEENEKSYKLNQDSLKEMEKEILDGSTQIDSLTEESFNLQQKIGEIEKQKLIFDGKIQSIKLKIQSKNQHLTEASNNLDKFKDAINSLNLKKSRVLMEIEQHTEKLLGEYYLTVKEAIDHGFEPVSSRSGQREVNRLREDIKGMGDVNLGAIEEYERLTKKLEFLKKQKNDLSKSRLDLQKIIVEMDKQMAVQFEETFNKINDFFNEIFKKLFGGGQGYLKLSEPNQILESGVEIFVQPPGKKMQSMSLLSGGEKALTAITLLFSILMTRPSPFCVLDEIEASLDEANVNRFASFLKELSNKSQFLVVTHRQGTMSYADMLYGVTMEDSGVSKLISVKFDDEKVG
ncbi:chromosome segregation protein SMC [Proteinivorax hydrogeniformans]|uniref:Chromosome partition protein Smc n=1 Tax=Proteinivorax hydrogeniformans TaxID=1826727 RepID=A0AAU8HP95_9FIRM